MTKKKRLIIALIIVIILFILLLLWFGLIYPNYLFSEQEKKLDQAGKRYFEINHTYIPKEENRVSSVSLKTLVDQKYLDQLYTPYHDQLCDEEASSVRVVTRDGKQEYYTYLKCGNYESTTDHQGPTITLNGKKKMTINRGEAYEEPGVESVVDNVDGKMDASAVTITGTVDTSQVGTYEIHYQTTDSLNNKTDIIRTVEVVENLATTVKSQTSDGYYKGAVDNNYLMFNHMLFRIVKVNDDDTVTIVSNDPLANVDYGSEDGRLADSSVSSWLNSYFYNLLEEDYQDMLVKSSWCDENVSAANITTTTCNQFSNKQYVGLLSVQDYNNSLDQNISYLDLRNLVWLANNNENNQPWAVTSIYQYPNRLMAMDTSYLLNVRPAVTLKANTRIVAGDGTQGNPYQIMNEDTGRRLEAINQRHTGEYISYSGYIWRIMGAESDGTTAIVMNQVLMDNGSEINIGYTDEGTEKVYNPNVVGNIGYQINNQLNRYLVTDLLAQKEIEVPIYEAEITYKGKKETEKYKVRISISSTFDIFSAKGLNSSAGGYWCIDSSRRVNTKVVVNPIGNTYYDYADTDDYLQRGVKVKAYLLKDVTITGGTGTLDDPYTITR